MPLGQVSKILLTTWKAETVCGGVPECVYMQLAQIVHAAWQPIKYLENATRVGAVYERRRGRSLKSVHLTYLVPESLHIAVSIAQLPLHRATCHQSGLNKMRRW